MTSSRFASALSLLGGFLVVATLATGCSPPESAVPAAPSYAADVRPIFLAHCVRCHGAGGTLNEARDPNGGPDAGPLPSAGGKPSMAYLGQYDDSGDCAQSSATNPCHYGAHTIATLGLLRSYLHPTGAIPPMPPPPSPRLDDWELKVVDAWLANPLP